jgi:hypothetical protein
MNTVIRKRYPMWRPLPRSLVTGRPLRLGLDRPRTNVEGDRSMNRSPTHAWKAGAALALIAGALALAPSGGAIGRYTDATGDNAGAPDITGVSVQSDSAGQLLFQIAVVDLPSPADIRTYLLLNTDMNLDTGAPDTGGADYYFGVDESDNTYWFLRWEGTDWTEAPYSTVRVDSNKTGVTISVNRSELGNTEAFTFWTRTRAGAVEANQADTAPEDGSWQYSLSADGPQIESVLVTTKPGLGPRAGKAFTVTPAGLRLPEAVRSIIAPQPDDYTCRARLAGRPLVGTGEHGCTWKLDRTSRGKRLVVQLTVSYQGTTARFTLSYRIA